ncbi:MAG: TraB/GumN family protein, partial [Pseudomonadota bacterium]
GRVALASVFLALQLTLSACNGGMESNEAEPYPQPNPPFYELANANGELEGWLLGSIHALPDGVLWRTPETNRAIETADALVVEVETLGISENISAIFSELSYSPGQAPLGQRVSTDLRPELLMMLAETDLNATTFDDIEDWGVAIILARVDAPGKPENGVDRALIAEFANRDIRGLETTRDQLSIFDRLASHDQRELLEGTIEEWAASRDNPEHLLRAWLVGDTEALIEAASEGIMADPRLRAALLVDRNTQWLEQLIPLLEEDAKPLIAVGAAHLVGPDGLVSMLEAKGYKVKRLPSS